MGDAPPFEVPNQYAFRSAKLLKAYAFRWKIGTELATVQLSNPSRPCRPDQPDLVFVSQATLSPMLLW